MSYCFDPQFEFAPTSVLANPQSGCQVTTNRYRFSTEYQIAATTRIWRDAAVEKVFRSYHPAGYGTRVVKKAHCPKTGFYWAIVRRSNSCD